VHNIASKHSNLLAPWPSREWSRHPRTNAPLRPEDSLSLTFCTMFRRTASAVDPIPAFEKTMIHIGHQDSLQCESPLHSSIAMQGHRSTEPLACWLPFELGVFNSTQPRNQESTTCKKWQHVGSVPKANLESRLGFHRVCLALASHLSLCTQGDPLSTNKIQQPKRKHMHLGVIEFPSLCHVVVFIFNNRCRSSFDIHAVHIQTCHQPADMLPASSWA
jgi:hypothetical protein